MWVARYMHWKSSLICSILATAITYGFAGPNGAIGMALGILGTAGNMAAIYWMGGLIGLAASDSGEEEKPSLGSTLTVIAFLAKLPILVFMGMYVQKLSPVAHTCFLLGLGLVYCAMIWWAVATTT